MSRKLIMLVFLMLYAYACFASRSLRVGLEQSLPFQDPKALGVEGMLSMRHTKIEPCMGASHECQVIMQKTTLLGMDLQNNKRSMIETQHGNQENKSDGGDEAGEVIHVKDYSDPSGKAPIHNHN